MYHQINYLETRVFRALTSLIARFYTSDIVKFESPLLYVSHS